MSGVGSSNHVLQVLDSIRRRCAVTLGELVVAGASVAREHVGLSHGGAGTDGEVPNQGHLKGEPDGGGVHHAHPHNVGSEDDSNVVLSSGDSSFVGGGFLSSGCGLSLGSHKQLATGSHPEVNGLGVGSFTAVLSSASDKRQLVVGFNSQDKIFGGVSCVEELAEGENSDAVGESSGDQGQVLLGVGGAVETIFDTIGVDVKHIAGYNAVVVVGQIDGRSEVVVLRDADCVDDSLGGGIVFEADGKTAGSIKIKCLV